MLYLSFFLLLLSYIFINKKTKYFKFVCLLYFLFFIISSFYFISNYFTWKWISEAVLFHIFYGLDWYNLKNNINIIIISILLLLFSILLPFLLYFFWKKTNFINKKIIIFLWILFLVISFIINPFTKNFLELQWFFNKEFKNNIDFYSLYKIPKIDQTLNKETKNIIFIYLESFEQTYLDNELFPWLTNWLNKLKNNSIYFENIKQAYSTNWTIWWMVWSQCWIPLIMRWDIKVNENIDEYNFLSWAFCIWDFLKKYSYNLNYYWWASLDFAWKWNFYKTHWFNNIKWSKELINELDNKNYRNNWWLYDDTTFDKAYEQYKILSKKDENFWLFLITLDTHWWKWMLSESCIDRTYTSNKNKNILNLLNNYYCTDYLLDNFIEKIKSSDNFKNTIIAITSDHLINNSIDSNKNIVNTIKEENKERKMLFMIIDENQTKKEIEKNWTTLDIWATVLSKMWFNIKNFWLWINLFSNWESLDNNTLQSYKEYYTDFWEKDNLSINKNIKNNDSLERIAHAWWIYKWKTYTNSINALEKNKNNYNLFEIDFSWTSDNKMVCIHDWERWFKTNFWKDLNWYIPNYKEFLLYVENNKLYKNCNLENLINWLTNNPNKYIVTDIKSNNIEWLKYITEKYPNYINRFIPQIYQPENYDIIKQLWYNKIIWTLYKYWKDNDSVITNIKNLNMDLYAITMPIKKVEEWLWIQINNLWIKTYSHTINSEDEFNKIQKLWIDEIYTDSLIKF